MAVLDTKLLFEIYNNVLNIKIIFDETIRSIRSVDI